VIEVDTVRCVVLDEADRLLELGFTEQVSAIMAGVAGREQTLMFSATWSPALQPWADQMLENPVRVETAARVQTPRLTRRVVHCAPAERMDVLVAVLAKRSPTLTLVFCETKAQCRAVTARLRDAGASAVALHGELAQRDRDGVLAQMRHGSIRILVATNVAARGLDLEGLDLVVCAEVTPDPDVHVHRVGRTARAGASGEAVMLVAGARERSRLESLAHVLGIRWQTDEVTPDFGDQLTGWDAPFRTLTVSGGRRDKLRAGDLLGALTRGVGLEGDDVGRIDVGEARTYVAIRRAAAGRALRGLAKVRIKKRKFRVSRTR
jgi:ATP-independent RNA helicase DbpA